MTIKLANITKKFDDKLVLDQFGHDFKVGKTTCIMGASGSGKTTLLRIMMGLESPDDGQVEGLQHLKKSVVFQEDRLCENLTVARNIKMASQTALTMEQILDVIKEVGLPADCIKQPVDQLSGGQKRRVAILRALVAEYDILFMDEPFKGIDLETKTRVMQYVKEMTQGKTVIFVTHDEMEAQVMSDEVVDCL